MSVISADAIVPRFSEFVAMAHMKPSGGNSAINSVDTYEWESTWTGPIVGTSTTSGYAVINAVNDVVTFDFLGMVFTPSVAPGAGEDIVFTTTIPAAFRPSNDTILEVSTPVVATSSLLEPQLCVLTARPNGLVQFRSAKMAYLTDDGFNTAFGLVTVPAATLIWTRRAAFIQ